MEEQLHLLRIKAKIDVDAAEAKKKALVAEQRAQIEKEKAIRREEREKVCYSHLDTESSPHCRFRKLL